MAVAAVDQNTGWRREVEDAARAATGGVLFGIPLLYTMEVWWIGSFAGPGRMLTVLALTGGLVFFLNRTGGFRSTRDIRFLDAAKDSVEALAISLVVVGAVLFLIREITLATPVREGIGKIIYEGAPFAVGTGFASHFLRKGRTEGDDDGAGAADNGGAPAINASLADIGATVLGAAFVAFSIAPTDEVPMIGAALSAPRLVAVVIVSLLVSYVIVFEGGFSNEEQRHSQAGVLQHPATETIVCYLLSLGTALVLLLFFGRVGIHDPYPSILTQVVVLGLPAAVGGAAGRLVV